MALSSSTETTTVRQRGCGSSDLLNVLDMRQGSRSVLLMMFLMLVLLLGCWVEESHAMGPHYYEMIEDMIAGVNYYEQLEIKEDATAEEIRKSFRRMALKYHPDKNSEEGAAQRYIKINQAYTVLSDEESRDEYNKLLVTGIPWHVRYYGRYAHRYGAPDHDIRYVVLNLVALITVLKYLYQRHRHYDYRRRAKMTQQYRNLVKLYGEKAAEEKLVIVGAEAPTWREIFVVQVVCSPWWFVRYLYKTIRIWMKGGLTPEELDEEMRLKTGMSPEEWKREKAKMESKQEAMRTSNRAKRYRRWMRQHTPVSGFGDD
eukprot:TRINITY_DN6650_c0_g1_i2.p1 TRINITY_DN6650_c0_g1~~TRINITY_DN6650_c0_g1_i2.p1  ORF type:complete len:315 (-),score=72.58 TRINITY_DN6650_c0_g1_i2:143-1087(-)